MALRIPNYIQRAGIQDNSLRYEWDEWNLDDIIFCENDEGVLERMEKISQRANSAYAIATAEWIVYRFSHLLEESEPFEYLEAAWAAIVNGRYVIYWEVEDEDWGGPVKGPIGKAITCVRETIISAYEDDVPAVDATSLFCIARHVISDPKPFKIWSEYVIKRLEKLYPLDEDDTLGDVVPREALDPDFDFKPEMTEELINKYLSALDYTTNLFLLSPEEMLDAGFDGTPYKFEFGGEDQDRI